MTQRSLFNPYRLLSIAVLSLGCASFIWAVSGDSRSSALSSEPAGAQVKGVDFSRFTHSNPNHARLPCLLCHRRETSARPTRPGHTPCAGCHAQEFAASSGPICTICHTDVGSAKPPVKPFPRLRSFNVRFDHAQHSAAECSTCHTPTARAVALSIPAGFSAHSTCYRCHTPRAQSRGRDISSCGTCHRRGRYSRTPVMTAAYRVNFSHAEHGGRQGLSCNDCHSI
ncbi:MAG TPA: cytochrome c3 family protein, partial [Blastocatellia bacterium]|nr:cytochrome c3 family protein [Blastocatellia bacterium]